MNASNSHDAQARRLAQAVVAAHSETACTECLDGLEAYVTAQMDGENYLALHPEVAAHLDGCVACAESYALVYEGRLAEQQVPSPAHVPAWDLSFLRGTAPASAAP